MPVSLSQEAQWKHLGLTCPENHKAVFALLLLYSQNPKPAHYAQF